MAGDNLALDSIIPRTLNMRKSMPSVTSAQALRIECTNPECKTQIVYLLETVKSAPTSCPVCALSWGDGIQAFRDALDVQRNNGPRKYKLHLEFGAEPFSVI